MRLFPRFFNNRGFTLLNSLLIIAVIFAVSIAIMAQPGCRQKPRPRKVVIVGASSPYSDEGNYPGYSEAPPIYRDAWGAGYHAGSHVTVHKTVHKTVHNTVFNVYAKRPALSVYKVRRVKIEMPAPPRRIERVLIVRRSLYRSAPPRRSGRR